MASAATKYLSKSAGFSSAVGNESPLLGGVQLQPSNTPLRMQAETCSQLSCALNSQKQGSENKNKQNKLISLPASLLLFISLLSLSLFFLRYQRLQSPPLVSGSPTFPVNLDRCKQGAAPAAELHTCRLALTHPCHSWDAVSKLSFLSSLV